MRLITQFLTDKQILGLDLLVRAGLYPNRAEAIRTAVNDLLNDELKRAQKCIT